MALRLSLGSFTLESFLGKTVVNRDMQKATVTVQHVIDYRDTAYKVLHLELLYFLNTAGIL